MNHVCPTLNPPPSPYPPSGWSQCTSPKHPVKNRNTHAIFSCLQLYMLISFQCLPSKIPKCLWWESTILEYVVPNLENAMASHSSTLA